MHELEETHKPESAAADEDVAAPQEDHPVAEADHADNHSEDREEAQHQVVDVPKGGQVDAQLLTVADARREGYLGKDTGVILNCKIKGVQP